MNKLEVNGCKKIRFPQVLKKRIMNDIIKIINKRINLKKDYKKINNIPEISHLLKNITQKEFISMFGHVSYRYLSFDVSKKINKWINKNLTNYFGNKKISLHYPTKLDQKKNKNLLKKQFCIYFRCVRPNSKTDVGKLHRDVDFWNLLKEHEKPLAPFKINNIYRIWIPLFGCNLQNSLKFYKKSHIDKSIKIKFFKKNGVKKPKIHSECLKNKRYSSLIKDFKNEAILFRDDVVHFAPINRNKKKIRYSVECSIVTN